MESYFKNKSILKVISRWKYHLLLITALGIILAVIGSSSWVITPKFKSTAVLYPVNLGTFSEESTTEQMLQILRSNEIKDSIIKVFRLDKHYKINPSSPHYKTNIYGEYDDNVSFSKTEFESCEIRVLDKDPKMACAIADSIISFYNGKVASMHRKKYWEVVVISKEAMNKKKKEMDSLETALDSFRVKYGLLDYRIQVTGISEGLSKGNTGPAFNNLYVNLEKFGQQFKDLDSLFKYAQRDYLWQKSNDNKSDNKRTDSG
jgi:capsule polysaccharide export protein KpsE/RkpR